MKSLLKRLPARKQQQVDSINRGGEFFPFLMSIATQVVSELLDWSSDIPLKNKCKLVLNSYLYEEPNLTVEELKKSLRIFLQGLE